MQVKSNTECSKGKTGFTEHFIFYDHGRRQSKDGQIPLVTHFGSSLGILEGTNRQYYLPRVHEHFILSPQHFVLSPSLKGNNCIRSHSLGEVKVHTYRTFAWTSIGGGGADANRSRI